VDSGGSSASFGRSTGSGSHHADWFAKANLQVVALIAYIHAYLLDLAPQARTIRCGMVQPAKDYAQSVIVRRRNHRYEPLEKYCNCGAGLPIVAPGWNARSHDPVGRYRPGHRKSRRAGRFVLDAGDESLYTTRSIPDTESTGSLETS
jgi:hypothetical protein